MIKGLLLAVFVMGSVGQADLVPTALNVDYISKMSGPDLEAKSFIERIISIEVGNDRVETCIAKHNLGIDGESNTCVDLRSHEDLKRVSRLVSRVVSSSKLVQVTEQDDCR